MSRPGASSTEQHIETIARWTLECEHLVVFTGAGISTDSGIPDFRGPDGVWTRRDAGLAAPRWRVPPGQVRPNASHLALAELQRLGKLPLLLTQNTHDLHRRSGIRPGLLAELHGNGHLMRCLGCDRQYGRQEVGWDAGRWGPGYRDPEAGGRSAGLPRLRRPADLVGGELRRPAAREGAGAG